MFQATSEVTALDFEVSVEARGETLTDLVASDFVLEVDGRNVEIDYFGGSAALRKAEAPGMGPGAAEDPTGEAVAIGDHVLVFVDSRHLSAEPRRRMLTALASFLETRLNEPDPPQVMVVEHADEVQLRLPFTHRGRTVRLVLEQMALEEFEPGGLEMSRRAAATQVASEVRSLGTQSRSRQGFDTFVSMTTLRPVLENYAAIENRAVGESLMGLYRFLSALAGLEGRKSVFLVSPGLSIRPLGLTLQRIQSRLTSRAGNVGDTVEVSAFESQDLRSGTGSESTEVEEQTVDLDEYDLTASFEDVASLANAYRVSIYSLRTVGAENESGVSEGEVESLSNVREGLDFLAQSTGGALVESRRSLGDAQEALQRVAELRESAYTLGFSAPEGFAPGRHEVSVSLKRQALRSRGVRRGNVAIRSPDSLQYSRFVDRFTDRVRAAMSMDLLNNPYGVRLELRDQKAQADGSVEAEFFLSFPLSRLALLKAEDNYSATGSVVVMSEFGDFGVGEPKRMAIDLRIPDAELSQAREASFGAPFALRLRPGATRVAVGVWDAVSGIGSYLGRTFTIEGEPTVP